jgi:streptomycin 6-kinase
VARLDTLTRVHTFVEDIELALDANPLDVAVIEAEDGYPLRSPLGRLLATSRCSLIGQLETLRSMMLWSPLPAGQSTTFRVRTSARNLEQVLDRPPVLRTANDSSTLVVVSVEGEIIVPAELAELHEKYSGEAGRLWIAGLPAMAAVAMDRWELVGDGQVASGAVALIIPVARRDGSKAVLKLQPVDDETGGEPAALRAWAGRGAVRLLEHDPSSGAMLLERLDASRDLNTMEDDLAATKIIAELLVQLNSVPAPTGMRHLGDVAAATLAGTPEAIRLVEDPGERRILINCAARLQELITDQIENRLLHWDLHYFNTLFTLDGVAEWKAIDPKPLSGDSSFELLPALWNRWDDLVRSGDVTRALLRRFDLMTEVLGLDRAHAAGWTLGRVLQNAVWDLVRFNEGHIYPEHRTIAEVLIEAWA